MKFVDDTLKVKGKYSMKRVLVAIAFPYTLWVGYRIVVYNETPSNAVQVFSSLLAFIVGVVVTSAYAKKQEKKENDEAEVVNQ